MYCEITGVEKIQPTNLEEIERTMVAGINLTMPTNNLRKIRELIEAGADLSYESKQTGNNALQEAAYRGFANTVQLLCEKFPQMVDYENQHGHTPFRIAVQERNRMFSVTAYCTLAHFCINL